MQTELSHTARRTGAAVVVAMAFGAASAQAYDCPVTHPNGSTPPRQQPSATWHGMNGIWTILPADGVVGWARRMDDGRLYAKFLWRRDRRAAGRFRIGGHRLDGAGPRLRYHASPRRRFVPSALLFPSEGCWKVIARAGRAHLQFVVQVPGNPPHF